MISRLTTAAALFAVLGTATLAFATEGTITRAGTARTAAATTPAGAALPLIVLPRVEVIGKRFR